MTLKVAYFAPTIIAAGPTPAVEFAKMYSLIEQMHNTYSGITDYTDPGVNIRGGQQITIPITDSVRWLTDLIEEMCKGYMDLVSTQSVTQDLNFCEPKVINLYTTKQSQGDYVEMHSHPAGNLSGNLYISVPDYAPGKFLSDGTDIFRLSQTKDITKFIMQDTWKYLPEPGTFVLFPSHVPHAVQPWKGEGHRIVLSFDAIIRVKEDIQNGNT